MLGCQYQPEISTADRSLSKSLIHVMRKGRSCDQKTSLANDDDGFLRRHLSDSDTAVSTPRFQYTANPPNKSNRKCSEERPVNSDSFLNIYRENLLNSNHLHNTAYASRLSRRRLVHIVGLGPYYCALAAFAAFAAI